MEIKTSIFHQRWSQNFMFPPLSIIHIKIYNHHPPRRIFHSHQSRKSECVDAYFPPMTSGHFLHGFFLRWKTFSEIFFRTHNNYSTITSIINPSIIYCLLQATYAFLGPSLFTKSCFIFFLYNKVSQVLVSIRTQWVFWLSFIL